MPNDNLFEMICIQDTSYNVRIRVFPFGFVIEISPVPEGTIIAEKIIDFFFINSISEVMISDK